QRRRGQLGDEQLLATDRAQRDVEEAPEVRVPQVLGRQIHADRERLAILPPDGRLEDRLTQHPERELAREAGSLDRGNELRRRKDASRWVPPTHQCLDREERAVLERDDRLVVEDELVLEDRRLELESCVDAQPITLPGR